MANKSLKLGQAWKEEFDGWTGELLLGRKHKATPSTGGSSSSWTGHTLGPKAPTAYAGKGSKQDVRDRLIGLTKDKCQVMFKITGGSKNNQGSLRHLAYLSREGELALTDQNGTEITGKENLKDLQFAWEHSGPRIDEDSERKETLNMVFSMPEGTDAAALASAVRATAGAEFASHQWVMVQHFDEPQVHAHIAVKIDGFDGARLNLRKADLQRLRERFAHELRQRGVEAEATRRSARMQQKKINKPWAVTRIEERGQAPTETPKTPDPAKAQAWANSFNRNAVTFGNVIMALKDSPDAEDQRVAHVLGKYVADKLVTHADIERPAPALSR